MSTEVDARGLSCPQPVLMALGEMKSGNTNEIEVLVDTEASKENVSRAAVSQGWAVTNVSEEKSSFRITIRKG